MLYTSIFSDQCTKQGFGPQVTNPWLLSPRLSILGGKKTKNCGNLSGSPYPKYQDLAKNSLNVHVKANVLDANVCDQT